MIAMSILKTLDNSLRVLTYFTKEKPSWGVRELAKEMDISHTIIFRIFSTFEKHGFLKKNEETNKYELGMRFLDYGFLLQDQLNIPNVIRPSMEELTEYTGESTVLTWLDGLEGVYVEIVESSRNIKFQESLGKRGPLYIGASHKVIMAFLPSHIQNRIFEQGLEKKTNKTMTDKNELIKDLQNIRKKGWGYSYGEYFEEVAALSVPLFNRNNDITASLTIASPRYRMSYDRAVYLLKPLQETQSEVQSLLSKLHNGNIGF